MRKVEFFHGGTDLIATVTATPYTYNWTTRTQCERRQRETEEQRRVVARNPCQPNEHIRNHPATLGTLR